MSLVNKILKTAVAPVAGKKQFQKLFETLYQFSLYGMNIGRGDKPETSGEKHALNIIREKLSGKGKTVIFDVGANVGNYTVLQKEVFGDGAEIHSFEPSLRTFEKLRP